MDTLTHNVYNYGCTGIFEKHKLLFSFQITVKLEMDLGHVRQDELDFFIKVIAQWRIQGVQTPALLFRCPFLNRTYFGNMSLRFLAEQGAS